MSNLKELLKEYDENDSISVKQILTDDIEGAIHDYVKKEYALYKKYGLASGMKYEQYSDKSGNWTIDDVDAYNSKVSLYYEDYWSYGGHTKFRRTFTADEVDNFDPVKLEEYLKNQRKSNLQSEINRHKESIRLLEEKLATYD